MVPKNRGSGESEFQGTSERGNFEEALQDAIAKAKNGLTTDLINWSLTSVSGVHGGFVIQETLTVTISAKVGPRSSG